MSLGAPQHLHFQQLFSLARRLGYDLDLQHIAFGSILGEDRKLMRTRSGESVPLRALLDEAVNRATAIVAEKNPELSEQDRLAIGRMVGIGAVKYAEFSQHRMTDYIFSWDKMLSLQGNTAPYLQNAYVRCRSIFRKLPAPFSGCEFASICEKKRNWICAKKILLFPDVVPAILDGFKPNILANYLYELAAEFHGFYESCPVLSAEPDGARDPINVMRRFFSSFADRARPVRDSGPRKNVAAAGKREVYRVYSQLVCWNAVNISARASTLRSTALKNDALMMSSLAERLLENAMQGLLKRDSTLCNLAIADDEEVDVLEKQIDKEGVEIMIRFHPVASDMRQVISTMKLSSNLERIADQSVVIARRAKKLNLRRRFPRSFCWSPSTGRLSEFSAIVFVLLSMETRNWLCS